MGCPHLRTNLQLTCAYNPEQVPYMQEARGGFDVVVVVTITPEEQTQYYAGPAQVRYSIRPPERDDRLLMDILWVHSQGYKDTCNSLDVLCRGLTVDSLHAGGSGEL